MSYIRNESHIDTIQSAANVAQVFLGTSMKCASCHNHFLNQEWPQSRFLAFAGLFGPKDLELIRCEKKSDQTVPAKFPFDLRDAPSTAPKDVESRLHRLAQLLTDPTNPRFAKTIVNRLWKRYFGLGLFEPVDDFRVERPPSHPELLEWLADDFMRHGYDLKRTIRLILTSRSYQLRHDPDLEDHFDVAQPTKPRFFRSPSLRRFTAEQFLDSIRVATEQELDPQERVYLDRTSTALSRALGRPASRNEISTSRPDEIAVLQALELLNGEDLYHLIYHGKMLKELTREKDLSRVVGRLYEAAWSRVPTQEERKLGVKFLETSKRSTAQAKPDPVEVVWLNDELPEGATYGGSAGSESWKWVSQPEHPVLDGAKAHTKNGTGEGQVHRHFVLGALQPLKVGPEDVLFAHVYLDPTYPPKQIMMEWYQGSWEHRAYWGEDLIPPKHRNSPNPPAIGPLPMASSWVRLEVPVSKLGSKISSEGITGWSFNQAGGGIVYWDKAGVVRVGDDPAVEPLGDLLWALFCSPAFQYLH